MWKWFSSSVPLFKNSIRILHNKAHTLVCRTEHFCFFVSDSRRLSTLYYNTAQYSTLYCILADSQRVQLYCRVEPSLEPENGGSRACLFSSPLLSVVAPVYYTQCIRDEYKLLDISAHLPSAICFLLVSSFHFRIDSSIEYFGVTPTCLRIAL